jgi:CHAD domain-containing protein
MTVTGATPGPPEVDVPEIDEDATAAELVRAGLLTNVAVLVEHEPMARLDEDPEGVHQARVGIRRTRSNLRTFRDLLEPTWRGPLDAELKRQAALLGHVRDADVLGMRLRRAIAELPTGDQAAATAMFDRLAGQRARAFADLRAELDSPAHADFIARLVEMVSDPVFAPGADGDGRGRSLVDRPAADVVPAMVAKPWRKLRKAVKALPPDDEVTPDELHEVRIRAKRARYACDAVRPVVGKPAKRLASRLGDLQDVLGDLHDTAVAEDWLRAAAGDVRVPRASALVAGLLVARERASGAALQAEWAHTWDQVAAVDVGWLRHRG